MWHLHFYVKKWTSFQFRYQLNFIKNTQVIDLVTPLKGILKHNKILVYIITILNPLRSRYTHPIIGLSFNAFCILKALCCIVIIMLYYKYTVFIIYFALLKLCHIVAYVLDCIKTITWFAYVHFSYSYFILQYTIFRYGLPLHKLLCEMSRSRELYLKCLDHFFHGKLGIK